QGRPGRLCQGQGGSRCRQVIRHSRFQHGRPPRGGRSRFRPAAMHPAFAEATDDGPMSSPDAPTTVRLDLWLWAARFFKTRSLAKQAVETGKVEVGGQRAKAAR